jgi:hypothetical protein
MKKRVCLHVYADAWLEEQLERMARRTNRSLTNTVIHIGKTYFQDELCAKRRAAETEQLSAVISSRVAANTESSSSW